MEQTKHNTTDSARLTKHEMYNSPESMKTTTEIELTIFTGPPDSRLTKAFHLGDEDKINKISQPNFSRGKARKIALGSVHDIANVIESLSPNECISQGVFDIDACKVVTADTLTPEMQPQGYRSRSLKHMHQPETGLILLDHDHCPHMPHSLRCNTVNELMEKLTRVIPELSDVVFAGRHSSSAGVHKIATGELLPSSGLHIYIGFRGNVKVLQEHLKIRLWNAGLGYISFARNGAMLERCLIDLSVLSPERLIYEAEPVLGPGIGRHQSEWVFGESSNV